MRGLNTRIAFANAKLLAFIGFDEDIVNDAMIDVLDAAKSEGVRDGYSGRNMPILYRDEPELIKFWKDGHSFAIEQQYVESIVDSCEECKDSPLGLCHKHFCYA